MISNKMVCMCLSQKIVLNFHPKIITFTILQLSNHLFDITFLNTFIVMSRIVAFVILFGREL